MQAAELGMPWPQAAVLDWRSLWQVSCTALKDRKFPIPQHRFKFRNVHSTVGDLNSEMPGDSENVFPHWGDVLGRLHDENHALTQTHVAITYRGDVAFAQHLEAKIHKPLHQCFC